MRADTEVIDQFGHAGSCQSGELDAVAATVARLPVAAAAPVFGPVGARFLAALADAAAAEAAAVAALGQRVETAAATAYAGARAYTAAEVRGRRRLSASAAGLGS